MRIAQTALVVAVVIVALLGYTKPGHRILKRNRTSQRLQARLQLRQLGGLRPPQLAASFIWPVHFDAATRCRIAQPAQLYRPYLDGLEDCNFQFECQRHQASFQAWWRCVFQWPVSEWRVA